MLSCAIGRGLLADFVVRFIAGTVKWLIICTVPAFALESVLNAPVGPPILKALMLGTLAVVGAVFIAFRLESALLSRLPSEEEEANV